MLTLPASVRVFVARGATDLRRSFDRLSAQVQEVLRQDPLSGHVFVFFNRQRNRVKLLVWERVLAAVQAAGGRDLRGAGAR
jgi:transposase